MSMFHTIKHGTNLVDNVERVARADDLYRSRGGRKLHDKRCARRSRAFSHLLITFLRQLAFMLLFAFLLAEPLGLLGVWLAFPAAECCGAAAGLFIAKKGQLFNGKRKDSKK